MRHQIKSKKNIDGEHLEVTVELLPDNFLEKNAIERLQELTASDAEKEMVENYLHFSLEELGDYTVVDTLSHFETEFVLKVAI
jgi:hypothetical protein